MPTSVNSDSSPAVLHGLAPVADARTRVVILGSFPGAASLAARAYYAHPQNQFWRIVGDVIGQPLATLAYRERLAALLDAGLGLWDVYASCTRAGSLDSAIRDAVPNDFKTLHRRAPHLRRVCHNGKTSARFAPAFADAAVEVCILPSTSPAYASLRYEEKLAQWAAALRIDDLKQDGAA